jgi:hypothetical protein
MALPDTSKYLFAIQQITSQKNNFEAEFTNLERTIGGLPITAMTSPHVLVRYVPVIYVAHALLMSLYLLDVLV